MRRSITGVLAAAAAATLSLAPVASATVLDFQTEDDFVTPLVNGQIVDTAFDPADPEFGNIVNISSTQLGTGGHLGATIFESTPGGDNAAGPDPDLLVGLGNILILQSPTNPATNVGVNGLEYTTPNDSANFTDRGSIVFDFLAPVTLQSLILIDANGGFFGNLVLEDLGGLTRTYTVPAMWTGDINVCGGCNGYDTLDMTSLAAQLGEGGSFTSVIEDIGFDALNVVQLDVQLVGNPASGGIDNLTFIPEPSTGLLVFGGLLALGARRRRS